MATLIGLPGVEGGTIGDVQYAGSVTEAMKILRTDRAVTLASDCGAINVWKDDAGVWRCERHYHLQTMASAYWTKKHEVRFWLSEHVPKIRSAATWSR